MCDTGSRAQIVFALASVHGAGWDHPWLGLANRLSVAAISRPAMIAAPTTGPIPASSLTPAGFVRPPLKHRSSGTRSSALAGRERGGSSVRPTARPSSPVRSASTALSSLGRDQARPTSDGQRSAVARASIPIVQARRLPKSPTPGAHRSRLSPISRRVISGSEPPWP
jgi:hypothetical protein